MQFLHLRGSCFREPHFSRILREIVTLQFVTYGHVRSIKRHQNHQYFAQVSIVHNPFIPRVSYGDIKVFRFF